MAFTLANLVDDTLRQLRGAAREEINVLVGSMDAPPALTQETINLTTSIGGVIPGALLTIDDESLFVLSSNEGAVTANVLRGYDGTTPTTHQNGALIYVDPPWTRAVIMDRLRDEIRSWGPQIFRVKSIDIAITNFQRGYDFPVTDTVIRVLRVNAPTPPFFADPGPWTTTSTSPTDNSTVDIAFEYDDNANTVLYPSGKSLTITAVSLPPATGNLHVTYACAFDVDTSWTDTTDLLTAVGLDERDLDIPPMGAAARLLRFLVVRRDLLNVQGQSREDQAVTVQSILQAAQTLEMTARSRKSDAMQRLLTDHPYTVSTY